MKKRFIIKRVNGHKAIIYYNNPDKHIEYLELKIIYSNFTSEFSNEYKEGTGALFLASHKLYLSKINLIKQSAITGSDCELKLNCIKTQAPVKDRDGEWYIPLINQTW